MITASQPSSLQTMKSLPQQVNMKKMVLENEGDTSTQLPCNLQRCEDGTEQEEQVLEMQKSTPIINSHKGIATGETSSYAPEYIPEDIHCWSFLPICFARYFISCLCSFNGQISAWLLCSG